MLKFASTGSNGKTIVGFGVSRGNVERLEQGKPMLVHLDEMGLAPYDILIFYGEDEAALHEAVKEFVGPDTKVDIDPRLKS